MAEEMESKTEIEKMADEIKKAIKSILTRNKSLRRIKVTTVFVELKRQYGLKKIMDALCHMGYRLIWSDDDGGYGIYPRQE